LFKVTLEKKDDFFIAGAEETYLLLY